MLFAFQLGNHGSNLTEEELETHTIAAWKEGKAYLNRQVDGHGRTFSRPLVHVSCFLLDHKTLYRPLCIESLLIFCQVGYL